MTIASISNERIAENEREILSRLQELVYELRRVRGMYGEPPSPALVAVKLPGQMVMIPFSPGEMIKFPLLPGSDILRAAIAHLRNAFSPAMSREDAQANIAARCLLINLHSQLLEEAEKECDRG